MKQNLFVTAIGTDSGKTLLSAILVEALKADYWKPVQAGEPTDTDYLKRVVSNNESTFHPEAYRLKYPMSPHAAAEREGISIQLKDLQMPQTNNHLVVEGAGGILVPLNQQEFVIDIASRFNLSVILVANLYLGSINHTLLTISELQRRRISVRGIVFNGKPNPQSEEVILRYSAYPCLLKIPPLAEQTPGVIRGLASEISANLRI